jgi:diaminopimelate decarboxylase
MSPVALNDSTSARIFSPVAASPTQELLRRLESWNVGFLAQSSGELQRALRAGARPSNIILCGAFKSGHDVMVAARIGLRALEVESFAEFEELCLEEHRVAMRDSPLRVCLRLETPWTPAPSGLRPDEVVVALERLRRLEHMVCVGLTVGWRECTACSPEEYDATLVQLRGLASNILASGHPIEFVMVGPRSLTRLGGDGGETTMRVTADHFAGAPFRVYFSCGDAIFRQSTHKVGRALRISRGADDSDYCYVDIRYTEGWQESLPLVPLREPSGSSAAHLHEAPSTIFLGRSSFDHQPVRLGQWVWSDLKPGVPVMLPCVGAAFAAAASASCSVPRPTEILVTDEGEVVVIRVRDDLERSLSCEM